MSHTYTADGSLPVEVREEFARIQRALNDAQPEFVFMERNAAPTKLFDGMVVRADGTNWDPGSGRGWYGYDSVTAAWIKLG